MLLANSITVCCERVFHMIIPTLPEAWMLRRRARFTTVAAILAPAFVAGLVARPQASGPAREFTLLGLNHRQLTYEHNGRDERPTITGGRVITRALS
jgi:hypothetical protein